LARRWSAEFPAQRSAVCSRVADGAFRFVAVPLGVLKVFGGMVGIECGGA
jgi:hypothetical protein